MLKETLDKRRLLLIEFLLGVCFHSLGIFVGFFVGFFQGGEAQENRELEEMKAELLKRSHELVETQRSLRKLQEVDCLEDVGALKINLGMYPP